MSVAPLDSWCGDLESPTRIEVDHATHQIYVTSPVSGTIGVYDVIGTLLSTITSVSHPSALAVDASGHLFVVDGAVIRKLAADGSELMAIGDSQPIFTGPHDVAIAPDGRIFVADAGDTIKVFDASGNYLTAFGSHGWFNGRLDAAVSLDIDPLQGELYVADQNNYRIQVYDFSGDSLRTWGIRGNGNYAPSQFLRLWGIELDASNRLWAWDEALNALQLFEPNGTFDGIIPIAHPELRTGLDIAIDGDRLYVTSNSLHCVLVYQISETQPVASRAEFLNLTVRAEAAHITLRWNRVGGASSYIVRRATESSIAPEDMETAATVTDTFFIDNEALSSWDRCFYTVTAVLEAGTMATPAEFENGSILRDHDPPHNEELSMSCRSCHYAQFNYPNPLPEWWLADQVCKGCHVESGMATAEQNHFASSDTMYCTTCHEPHDQQDQYAHNYLRGVIQTPHNGWRVSRFNNEADFIHGAPNYDGICEVCHTETAYHRNNSGGDHSHNAGATCTSCHQHRKGFQPTGGACNSCHDAPPQTAAHMAHVGAPEAGVGYGDLRQTSDFFASSTVYNFGCGNCHPADASHHQNGAVDVELYDPAAPTGTLKALNPPSASYSTTSQTCSNVYCHSATTWVSGPVGDPLYDTNNRPILDANGNLTYDPFTLTVSRQYQTMNWGGTSLDCNGCHRNGPQTTYPVVNAGVGNSHGWIDDWGYEDLHAYNMASDPLTCRVCHYATVTAAQTWSRDVWDVTTYNDVAIASTARHLNGVMDVVFDSVNAVFVQGTAMSLASSSYNAAQRTCSSVPCHGAQQTPEWGKPYRWWDTAECDQCHNMTGWFGSGRSGTEYHPDLRNRSCNDCHAGHSR